jgi:tetratricopeptide (TPR) repeat protein
VIAGVLLASGCAHRTVVPAPVGFDAPARVELSETPFFPQTRYQCGPAALATVLAAQGRAADPDALVDRVYLPARRGSLQAEIVAAARGEGLLAVTVAPTLDALLAEIAAGRPVLVLQNLGLDWLPRWHYAVAIGYDLAARQLILRSGTEPRRLTRLDVFARTWDRSGRWGIVVLPPGEVPASATPARYLEAVSALEALGHVHAAQAGYRAASRQWPEHTVAWLGLGNAEYALANYGDAEAAFRRALALAPGEFSAWNNLAYALAARRCTRLARDSAQCAVRLAPDSAVPGQTLGEMDALATHADEACRPLPPCPAS